MGWLTISFYCITHKIAAISSVVLTHNPYLFPCPYWDLWYNYHIKSVVIFFYFVIFSSIDRTYHLQHTTLFQFRFLAYSVVPLMFSIQSFPFNHFCVDLIYPFIFSSQFANFRLFLHDWKSSYCIETEEFMSISDYYLIWHVKTKFSYVCMCIYIGI